MFLRRNVDGQIVSKVATGTQQMQSSLKYLRIMALITLRLAMKQNEMQKDMYDENLTDS